MKGTVSYGTPRNHEELMDLIQSKGDQTQLVESGLITLSDPGETSDSSSPPSCTSTINTNIKPCSVSVGIKDVKQLDNFTIPLEDLEYIKNKCPTVSNGINKRNLVISGELKQRMCDNFKQNWNSHQTQYERPGVQGDIHSNLAIECNDREVNNTQCTAIDSDSDVDILESSVATEHIPSSMSAEISYMQGNGDISPNISQSPTVQELQHAEEQLLDCDDTASIAALIYVIDKYVEQAQVIHRLDHSLIQSNKFVQFRDIRSLGEKLVTNGNKLRFLADKILQIINLELNVGSGGDKESGMNASPVEQADSGPNATSGDNGDSD